MKTVALTTLKNISLEHKTWNQKAEYFLFRLSWEHAHTAIQIFLNLHIYVNDWENASSISSGLQVKFKK